MDGRFGLHGWPGYLNSPSIFHKTLVTIYFSFSGFDDIRMTHSRFLLLLLSISLYQVLFHSFSHFKLHPSSFLLCVQQVGEEN